MCVCKGLGWEWSCPLSSRLETNAPIIIMGYIDVDMHKCGHIDIDPIANLATLFTLIYFQIMIILL